MVDNFACRQDIQRDIPEVICGLDLFNAGEDI